MSVWQDWLIGLAYVYHTSESQNEVSELVWEAFSILLHHALRHEYGGWRVWVDTLAIAHSKVSFEKFKKELAEKEAKAERTDEEGTLGVTPIYRAPEFVWSDVHVRLLTDLLAGIERVVDEWKVYVFRSIFTKTSPVKESAIIDRNTTKFFFAIRQQKLKKKFLFFLFFQKKFWTKHVFFFNSCFKNSLITINFKN